jgi:hypothetical protein
LIIESLRGFRRKKKNRSIVYVQKLQESFHNKLTLEKISAISEKKSSKIFREHLTAFLISQNSFKKVLEDRDYSVHIAIFFIKVGLKRLTFDIIPAICKSL